MNCNLFDDSSSRAKILNSMCPQLVVVKNAQGFTYIHNSGSTSSLDFSMCSSNVKQNSGSSLISTFENSEHMPISNIFPVQLTPPTDPSPDNDSKCHETTDWACLVIFRFWAVRDFSLEKIKVPFHLLSKKTINLGREANLTEYLLC